MDKGKGRASELGPAEAVARPVNTSSNSSNRLTKRGSPSPSRLSPPGHTPAHRAHPTQPSPSPSQINNPSIYAAPPAMPPRRSPAPPNHTANLYPSYVPDTFHRPPGAYPMPQRPVSAYGGYMGPPPPQQQQHRSPGRRVTIWNSGRGPKTRTLSRAGGAWNTRILSQLDAVCGAVWSPCGAPVVRHMDVCMIVRSGWDT